SVTGGPAETSIFLSLPSATKAMKRLSGDQNGDKALAVAGSGCAIRLSSARTHNTLRLLESGAMNARRRPSGESASLPTAGEVRFAGGTKELRYTRVSPGGRRRYIIAASPSVVTKSAAAAIRA